MNILVTQRRSKTANNTFSLSVETRLLEIMNFLKENKKVHYAVAYADEVYIKNIVQWADIVLISRNLSENELALMKWAKKLNKRVIFDIDDYMFSKPSYSQQGEFSQDNIAKLHKYSAFIDCIVVANEILQTALAMQSIASTIVQTRVNKRSKKVAQHTEETYKYVYTTTDNIKLNSFKRQFVQMLQDFHAEYQKLKMVVYSDTIYELIKLPFVEWFPRMHYKEYVSSLAQGEYLFSVIPLGGEEDEQDLLFHTCKSPVKYFDYGLAGIPGIYSAVPLYKNCIVDKITGLLAKNDCNDWYNKMKQLYHNEALRNSIIENAYNDICENYSMEESACEYYSVMQNVL